jgi:hypothetical protein
MPQFAVGAFQTHWLMSCQHSCQEAQWLHHLSGLIS